jgi:hypothetical protein
VATEADTTGRRVVEVSDCARPEQCEDPKWCEANEACIRNARDEIADRDATIARLETEAQAGSEACLRWAAELEAAKADANAPGGHGDACDRMTAAIEADRASRGIPGLLALVEAAREIRRVHDVQAKYVRELQEIAADARRLGQSQSHRIGPRVHDYGNGVDALLAALAKYERRRPRIPREGGPK